MGMTTGVKVTGETDMGEPVRRKKTGAGYKSWIVLASGLFATSLGGGFLGSWYNETDSSQLSVVADKLTNGVEKLVPIIAKLDTKVNEIRTNDRTDEILLAIDKLDQKIDVAPDLIAGKIKIPACPKEEPKIPCEQECPDSSILPYYHHDNYFYCPENECSIDIPTNVEPEPKPDTALRVICVNRYGPTRCMPSLDKAVIVTRGYIRECLLVNDNLKCEREKRLR
jgi:hypothetical protein